MIRCLYLCITVAFGLTLTACRPAQLDRAEAKNQELEARLVKLEHEMQATKRRAEQREMELRDVITTMQQFQDDRELDVHLPTAVEAQPLTSAPNEVFVSIDKAGQYSVGGEELSSPELAEMLGSAVTESPQELAVIIRADGEVPLHFAVAVIDLCNKLGIYDYSLTIAAAQTGGDANEATAPVDDPAAEASVPSDECVTAPQP